MKRLFTERHSGLKPRTKEELDEPSRTGLLSLIAARIDEHWFGQSFPSDCPDGQGNAGTDLDKLRHMMAAYGVIWPEGSIGSEDAPADGKIFDLIEFSYEHVAEPTAYGVHSYWGHSHYSYGQDAGRTALEEDVNRIFERNGIAYQLEHGEITRIAPTVLHEALQQSIFKTGDDILDRLLDSSREKFLNREPEVRRESLEKLWDAWERLKTVEPGKDKKTSANALLDKAADEFNFRKRLENEAKELTEIGNTFMIRHTETDKVPVSESVHVDYLFHRMFALIWLLLDASGRSG